MGSGNSRRAENQEEHSGDPGEAPENPRAPETQEEKDAAEIAQLKIDIAKMKRELGSIRFAEMARYIEESEAQDPILENHRMREAEERAKNQGRCNVM